MAATLPTRFAPHVVRLVAWRWAFDGACRHVLPARVHAAVPNMWDAVCNLWMLGWLARLARAGSLAGPWALRPADFYQGSRRDVPLDEYLVFEAAWYVAGLLNAQLWDGGIEAAMAVHHVIAVALIQACLLENVTRIGAALLPFMLISNPLLHAARALHRGGAPPWLKRAALSAFALVFFASRVLAFPALYLRVTLFAVGRHWLLGGEQQRRVVLYVATNGLLLVLYALQLMWLRRVVQTLRNGGGGGGGGRD
jgi:TLC domain